MSNKTQTTTVEIYEHEYDDGETWFDVLIVSDDTEIADFADGNSFDNEEEAVEEAESYIWDLREEFGITVEIVRT